jgi:hypothetical protein
MRALLATAGGFRGDYGTEPPEFVLAPGSAPKLVVLGLLVLLLVAWAGARLGAPGR